MLTFANDQLWRARLRSKFHRALQRRGTTHAQQCRADIRIWSLVARWVAVATALSVARVPDRHCHPTLSSLDAARRPVWREKLRASSAIACGSLTTGVTA